MFTWASAPHGMELQQLILARRSIRRFTSQPVTVEDEIDLLAAACAAPSGQNLRPAHFVVVRDPEMRAQLSELGEWAWMLRGAPLVIAVLGDEDASPFWIEDCSAAAENILLAAVGRGLGAVWCAMREEAPGPESAERRCIRLLVTPPGFRVLCLVGVGHPDELKAPSAGIDIARVSHERFGRE